jgi:hypothetical protein
MLIVVDDERIRASVRVVQHRGERCGELRIRYPIEAAYLERVSQAIAVLLHPGVEPVTEDA